MQAADAEVIESPKPGLWSTAVRSLLILSVILLTACGGEEPPVKEQEQAAIEPPAAKIDPPVLIERNNLFGNPTRVQGRISPDGAWLSWLAPLDGVMNIFVAPVENPAEARALTADTGRGIPIHFWSHTSEHVLYTQDKGGDENDHIYSVAIDSGEVVDLTPVADGVKATLDALSKERPDTVLVGLNERDASLFDLYEITISTGERKLIRENPGYIGWLADNELTPRLASRPLPGGDIELLSIVGDEPETLFTIAAEDVLLTNTLGFDKANEHLFVINTRGRDKAALYRINLETRAEILVAEDSRADIETVIMDPVSLEPAAYSTNFLRVEWHGLQEDFGEELARVSEVISGDLSFVSATDDGNTLVVYADLAEKPGVYYLYDRTTREARELFATRPALAGVPLAPMHAVEIGSRDGLSLVSYLTLPIESDSDRDGRPEEPQSMVLFVHGGPWARDEYGYNSVHQWLANRGHAVLSVNYRGSTGFGKAFVNAAEREFAGKMHDDLIDAVDWAVREGIAQKDQIAIMGGSYGGYATLVGVTFTPDTFACGVDIVGPSNLITLIESFPDYWGPSLEFTWYKYVGNPENEPDRADMYNRSPIARVNDIKVPLLIGQGENDPRVTKLESDQIVAAMSQRDLPVTYLNYPDEGHGFARPENSLAFFATSEAFLSSCLGGRYQPIGDDFTGSSVQVLHGAEYVPGLSEAIAPADPAEAGGS